MKNSDKKCIWSGTKSPDVKTVQIESVDRFGLPTQQIFTVLPEHEKELRAYNAQLQKHAKTIVLSALVLPFLFSIMLLLYAVLSIPQSYIMITSGMIISAMGSAIILFPFSTPETIRWLGIRRAVQITRFLGVSMIVFGIGIVLFL